MATSSYFRALLLALVVAALVTVAQSTSGSVSGLLRDPAGNPVTGVNAELRLEQAPYTLFSLRPGDDGKFKFTVLPAGKYTLTVAQLGFKTLKVKSIELAAGENRILPPLLVHVAPTDLPWMPIPVFNLRVGNQPFGNLAGRVMQDEERALAGATVQLFCDDQPCGETKTDTNGDFVFFNLAARDDYGFRISHPQFLSWQGTARGFTALEVLAGYDASYAPIVLPRRAKLSRAANTVR